MRLRLDLTPDADEACSGDTFVVVLRDEPWLRIEISPLIPVPLDFARWMRDRLTAGVEDPALARVLGSAHAETIDGWPYRIIEVMIGDGVATVEHRLVAVYELLGHVAAVVMRTADSQQYHLKRETLLPLLETARPSWRTRTPVAIGELWDLDATPPNA